MTHTGTYAIVRRSAVALATVSLCGLAALLPACSPQNPRAPSDATQPPGPAVAQPPGPDVAPIDPGTLDASEPLDERTLRAVREFYERARKTGERVPDEVEDWTRETVTRIYAWD